MKLRNKRTGEIIDVKDALTDSDDYPNHYVINDEWEDTPEEPKKYWCISWGCAGVCENKYSGDYMDEFNKSIGNYFSSKEEAEKAIQKLKAFKRLKDKGFRFDGWEDLQAKMSIDDLLLFNRDVIDTDNVIGFRMDDYHDCIKDLNILFGGEE